jgi:hypothetical protein
MAYKLLHKYRCKDLINSKLSRQYRTGAKCLRFSNKIHNRKLNINLIFIMKQNCNCGVLLKSVNLKAC